MQRFMDKRPPAYWLFCQAFVEDDAAGEGLAA